MKIDIGMVGCGVVGSGVARIILKQAAVIEARTGIRLKLKRIVTKDTRNATGIRIPPRLIGDDLQAILDDESIGIVVQVVGGVTAARQIMKRLLAAGKHVVTANKALLAEHGRELFALARKHGVTISFEGSVGGGIPLIGSLHQGYLANTIVSIVGILNGTSNYILTRMDRDAMAYSDALAEAQKAGYAEADPTLDVGGGDAAHKIMLLARCGMGVDFDARQVHVEGIEHVELQDIQFARALGYSIKLLGIAKRVGGGVELRVHPTLVSHKDPLAHVPGNFNAIEIDGDAVGPTLLYGQGAGQMPTASAVVSDVLNVAMGRAQPAFESLALVPDRTERAPVVPIQNIHSRFYLRLTVVDSPGVLAKITKILGDNRISILSVVQNEVNQDKAVPLFMTTHNCRELDMERAAAAIAKLGCVKNKPCQIRVHQ